MRVLILTFGTRGDIEPYAALAEQLQRDGHSAVLCAPEAYRDDIETRGVGFEPAGTEMHEIVRAEMTSMAGPRDAIGIARRMMQAMRESLREQWEASQRADPTLIVAHPKALGGFHIAERLGIPFVASLPLPFLTPTGDFPIPFMARDFPERVNRLTYQFNRFTAVAYGGMINRFRSEHLGLGRISRFSDYLHRGGERVPVLYPISSHVVPRPTDYPDSAHITGYWFREGPHSEWAPPPRLETFLQADSPVVYIGFGSMGFGRHADERGQLVLDAVRQVGVRAIIATGWGGLSVSSSDDVLVVDEAPHDWLFPRVSAVVHHGGSGTTAAGLKAGRPTFICPVLGDQPFWGERIHQLGAGPKPLLLRKARVETMARGIAELLETPAYATNATALAEQINAEDGAAKAVRILERLHSTASAP